MAQNDDRELMDKLISLCKRRGFIFQSSEIYPGPGHHQAGPGGDGGCGLIFQRASLARQCYLRVPRCLKPRATARNVHALQSRPSATAIQSAKADFANVAANSFAGVKVNLPLHGA